MIDSGRALRRLLSVPALLAGVLLPTVCHATLVGPGDLAFIRFNGAGGTTFDDFAIVLLADADVGQVVAFNANPYDNSARKFSNQIGDHIIWEIDETLAAGTVVSFTELNRGVDNPSRASAGVIRDQTPNMMPLAPNGQTIYAYLGDDLEAPDDFLAGISTASIDDFEGTGLIPGQTAVYLPLVAGDEVDEAHYIGDRSNELAYPDYLPLIGNVNANWERRNSQGTLTPFDSSNFTLQNGTSVPESPAVITFGMLMLLACLSQGARWRRQPAVALKEAA